MVDGTLSRAEERLVEAAMRKVSLSLDEFVEAYWDDPETQPDYWKERISLILCNLRKKTKPLGYELWQVGEGWNANFVLEYTEAAR